MPIDDGQLELVETKRLGLNAQTLCSVREQTPTGRTLA